MPRGRGLAVVVVVQVVARAVRLVLFLTLVRGRIKQMSDGQNDSYFDKYEEYTDVNLYDKYDEDHQRLAPCIVSTPEGIICLQGNDSPSSASRPPLAALVDSGAKRHAIPDVLVLTLFPNNIDKYIKVYIWRRIGTLAP